MKKIFNSVGSFLLALVSLTSIGYTKVKADTIREDNDTTRTSETDNNSDKVENNEIINIGNLDTINQRIELVNNYYKTTEVSKNCIIMLNYPYLKAIGYSFPEDMDSYDLSAISTIKNTENGWSTLNLSFALKCDNEFDDNNIMDNWRELEKLYLREFVEKIQNTRVLKYSPLLLDPFEYDGAMYLEELCYQIYNEYYAAHGNINSIRLNSLIIKLMSYLNDDNNFKNRGNGYYKILSEILSQFRYLYTYIDARYNNLSSIIAKRIEECKNKYTNLTSYIILTEGIYDYTFGFDSLYPYSEEYKKNEKNYNKIYNQGNINSVFLLNDSKIFMDIEYIKRYYTNKINTIFRYKKIDNNIDIFSDNFLEILNNDFLEDNLYFSSNANYDIVYESLATIYRCNIDTMKRYYNPQSELFTEILGNINRTRLILSYSELVLSRSDYQALNSIEKKYYEIINDFVIYACDDYLDISYYKSLEDKLNNISKSLDDINSNMTSDIISYMMIKQMNDYIDAIILNESVYNVPNISEIRRLINSINTKNNKKYGEHIIKILESVEKQNRLEEQKTIDNIKVRSYKI